MPRATQLRAIQERKKKNKRLEVSFLYKLSNNVDVKYMFLPKPAQAEKNWMFDGSR